jgi:hypothetical protein
MCVSVGIARGCERQVLMDEDMDLLHEHQVKMLHLRNSEVPVMEVSTSHLVSLPRDHSVGRVQCQIPCTTHFPNYRECLYGAIA